jgi:hypothetical protein
MAIRPSIDFLMSIGADLMKIFTAAGMVITATGQRRGRGGR